eukprot:4923217-Amphidinium_carterae.1
MVLPGCATLASVKAPFFVILTQTCTEEQNIELPASTAAEHKPLLTARHLMAVMHIALSLPALQAGLL